MKRWLNFSQLAWGNHRDKSRAGYTITEVMIVLAISASLFGVVALLLQGRQKAAQYTQSIRDLEGRIQSVASDVQNGFFTSSFDCEIEPATGEPRILETNENPSGTNEPCVFMGKVIHFNEEESNLRQMDVLTMVGRRTVVNESRKVVATNLLEAQSVPVDSATTHYSLMYGLEVTRLTDISSGEPIDNFGFMIHIAGSGTSQVSPVSLFSVGDPVDPSSFSRAVKGVRICVAGPTGQPGQITVGAAGDGLSTNVEIGTDQCE